MKQIATLCLVLVVAASGAFAQTRPDLGNNAALRYWAAFAFLPDRDTEFFKILQNWDTVPLDAKVDQLLANPTALKDLHSAAQIRDCDWGLDYSLGPNLLLPQTTDARMLANYVFLRARMEFQEQQYQPAVEDECDVMALGRHISADRIPISHFLQNSLENAAITQLAAHLKELDHPAINDLVSRLANLPPFLSFAEAMQTEANTINWYAAHAKASPPDKLADIFTALNADPSMRSPIDRAIHDAGGTSEGVAAALTNLKPFYVEEEKLFRQNLSQAEFHKQADALKKSYDEKPFGRIVLANFISGFDSAAVEATQMVMLNAAIDIVQNGPEKAKDLRDPVNHDPIDYSETGDGFQLQSTVTRGGNKPVVLKVGGHS